jgi:hypothetical protein
MPLGRVARPGGHQSGGKGNSPPHARRLRGDDAHLAARSDDQARSTRGSGPDWPRSTSAGHDKVPSGLPATARHAARQRPRQSHLGPDPQLHLPARVLSNTGVTRRTRVGHAIPPAPSRIIPAVTEGNRPLNATWNRSSAATASHIKRSRATNSPGEPRSPACASLCRGQHLYSQSAILREVCGQVLVPILRAGQIAEYERLHEFTVRWAQPPQNRPVRNDAGSARGRQCPGSGNRLRRVSPESMTAAVIRAHNRTLS